MAPSASSSRVLTWWFVACQWNNSFFGFLGGETRFFSYLSRSCDTFFSRDTFWEVSGSWQGKCMWVSFLPVVCGFDKLISYSARLCLPNSLAEIIVVKTLFFDKYMSTKLAHHKNMVIFSCSSLLLWACRITRLKSSSSRSSSRSFSESFNRCQTLFGMCFAALLSSPNTISRARGVLVFALPKIV